MFAIPTLTLMQDIRKSGMEAALKYYQDSKIDKVRVDMFHDSFFLTYNWFYMVSMWFLFGFYVVSIPESAWAKGSSEESGRLYICTSYIAHPHILHLYMLHLHIPHPHTSHLYIPHPGILHLHMIEMQI